MSCVDFYKYIKTKPKLLQQIATKEKYKSTTKEGEIIVIEDDSDDTADDDKNDISDDDHEDSD